MLRLFTIPAAREAGCNAPIAMILTAKKGVVCLNPALLEDERAHWNGMTCEVSLDDAVVKVTFPHGGILTVTGEVTPVATPPAQEWRAAEGWFRAEGPIEYDGAWNALADASAGDIPGFAGIAVDETTASVVSSQGRFSLPEYRARRLREERRAQKTAIRARRVRRVAAVCADCGATPCDCA